MHYINNLMSHIYIINQRVFVLRGCFIDPGGRVSLDVHVRTISPWLELNTNVRTRGLINLEWSFIVPVEQFALQRAAMMNEKLYYINKKKKRNRKQSSKECTKNVCSLSTFVLAKIANGINKLLVRLMPHLVLGYKYSEGFGPFQHTELQLVVAFMKCRVHTVVK